MSDLDLLETKEGRTLILESRSLSVDARIEVFRAIQDMTPVAAEAAKAIAESQHHKPVRTTMIGLGACIVVVGLLLIAMLVIGSLLGIDPWTMRVALICLAALAAPPMAIAIGKAAGRLAAAVAPGPHGQ